MNFEPSEFNLLLALGYWALAVLVLGGIGLLVGLTVALIGGGTDGLKFALSQAGRVGGEFASLSPTRVGAVTKLTIKESLRRKALYVFGVFALLFMFAGWFFGQTEYAATSPYIVFVLKTIRWLSLPMAVLLACWGLPQDIKARSLHTVVTKPVHRMEVVFGRILGYSAVMAGVVLVMGVIGYVWITRSVPDYLQGQLIGRVPVLADGLKHKGKAGEDRQAGINVGDMFELRTYIEGDTRARAIFHFHDFDDTAAMFDPDEEIPLEYTFEVFRSYKGDVGEDVLAGRAERAVGTRAQLAVVKDLSEAEGPDYTGERFDDRLVLRFPEFPFELAEYETDIAKRVLRMPRTFERDAESGVETYALEDVYQDLDGDGDADDLAVEVRLLDGQQYLGYAKSDLFVRLPDRSFLSGYAKAVAAILLMCVLVVILGTTASTFVKGPVATLLTLGLIGVGLFAQDFAQEYLGGFQSTGEAMGGGPIESAYRLVTQKSQTGPLPDSAALTAVKKVDRGILKSMQAAFLVLPDLRTFDLVPYVAAGFDPPFYDTFLPALLTVLAFLLPCLIVGYLSLQLRELEAK